MTTPPLSPAAQAVLDAVVDGALPPFHVIARPMAAAAIRALVERVASQIPDNCSADVFNRQLKIRSEILAIAAELYGGEGQRTTQPAPPPEPRGCPTPGACSCPTAPIVPPELIRALEMAEAALSDIGDADREPGDDIAWAERRAAQDLPRIRHALRTWRDHATPPAATREAGPQAGAEISTEEWYALKEQLWDQFETVGHQGERFMWFASFDAALDKARAVLARWGGAAVPVPVSERPWERQGWLDAEGCCWATGGRGDWIYVHAIDRNWRNPTYTHLLPQWALPVPAAAAGDC